MSSLRPLIPLLIALLTGCSAPPGDPPPLRPVSEWWDYEPAWSPDGRQIAFCSSRASHPTLRLFVMDADGGRVRQVTDADSGRGDCFPSWSPDGGELAFTSDRTGNRDVYRVRIDGSGLQPVTRDTANDGLIVSWSPDGKTIAFHSDRDGPDRIFLVDIDGRHVRRISAGPGVDMAPAFSPDGRMVAFSSTRTGGPEIWVTNADGTGPRQVTDLPGNEGDPSWSPDGRRILFYSNQDDPQYEIYAIGVDGSGLTRLTRSHNWDLDARFSPDGTRLAWHSSRTGRYGIVVSDSAGRHRRRLTNAGTSDFARLVRTAGVSAALAADSSARARHPDSVFVLGDELVHLVHELVFGEAVDDAVTLARYALPRVRDSLEGFELLGYALRAAGQPAGVDRSTFVRMVEDGRYEEAESAVAAARAVHPRWQITSPGAVNAKGYRLLAAGRAAEARRALRLNTIAWPEVANSWDSYGDAQLASGDSAGARDSFGRACRTARTARDPNESRFCRRADASGAPHSG